MTKQEMIRCSLAEHARALRDRLYSAEELTLAYLSQIRRRDAEIGAFLSVDEEGALALAKASDKRRHDGQSLSALDGIPVGLKDNICYTALPTTCGSRMLEGWRSPYNATVCQRLLARGAVILGKTNMDEFAMGSSTEFSAFHPTKNPLCVTHTPGGSSGGSAAAVAAHMLPAALGSDTGGSVRQPAAFCGLVGMKPTYGSVSRYGLVAFASSLEQIGPLTHTVKDNALLLSAIAGADTQDATCRAEADTDFSAQIGKDIRGIRIGIPRELWEIPMQEDIRSALEKAIAALTDMGARLFSVSLPALSLAAEAYYVICAAEASSNLARFDGVRFGHRTDTYESIDELYAKSRGEGFGTEVKRRIMLGNFVLSAGYYDRYYQRAQQQRRALSEQIAQATKDGALLLCPVSPSSPPLLGSMGEDPTVPYRNDLFCVPANLSSVPALSLPCGKDSHGLPVGIQLMGGAYTEPLLYRVGAAWETQRGGERA